MNNGYRNIHRSSFIIHHSSFMNTRQLYYSFPVRLLMLHWRNHLVLLALWLFIALMMTGVIGRFFGMHYLLLTPEYRGEVDFWSFFITGAAFGAFFMIWNLTTYLLSADRFPFLATLDAPFTKFCLNNSLLPLAFLATWLGATIWFQWHDELTHTSAIFFNIVGFLTGMVILISLIAAYLFFTNKDIGAFLRPRKFIPRPGGRLLIPGYRLPTLGEIQSGATRWRVDTYLNERLHPRLVRSVAHYDKRMLEQVFKQNHWNAVVVQIVALFLLMSLGLFMDSEWVRIPAAATLFLFASMIMALFGAIVFWFRHWGTLVFLSLMVAVNMITGMGLFNYRNRAYGLDYQHRAEYSYAALDNMCSRENLKLDEAATLKILEHWLAKNLSPEHPKPKMVFVCVSGGGMRSSLWTMQTLQQADRALNGRLLRQTMLISGASGGMLGAAYMRELYLRQQMGEPVSIYDSTYLDDISKDLLNPVCFAVIANDLFFPLTTFESGGFSYREDRGYLFERQLNENCRGYLSRRLADYRQPEADAKIPMMVVSPFILNDMRRLIISPQGVSYLMKPPSPTRIADQVEVDGVDFGKLFAAQNADSLSFNSALRMNCTFPFILPNAWLPSDPSLEIMDAGLRDNYGLSLPIRFVHAFRDWIEENTDGVVFVSIRCWEKKDPITKSDSKGVIENLFSPASAAANVTAVQDFEQDNALALLSDLLGKNRVNVIRFIYRPVRKQREASMSLHLSTREKLDLREAFYTPENDASLKALKRILGK